MKPWQVVFSKLGPVVAALFVVATIVAALLVVATIVRHNRENSSPAGSIFAGALECTEQSDVRVCGGERSTVPSFDGTPIDITVATPNDDDRPFPLLLTLGGWPGGKFEADLLKIWPKRGYAALSMSNRGTGDSGGFAHFMDTRYEVRDAQELIGKLVDAGIADPQRIGVLGGSYGGGQALALGALRNRVMKPNGKLVPWKSPDGTPLSVHVALSQVAWSDLAHALLPNGSLLDFVAAAPYQGPVGPLKLSSVKFIYEAGKRNGVNYGAGRDPRSNFETWFLRLTGRGGETPSREAIAREMSAHHSAAGIDDSVEPAPTFMVSGFSDDLLPANQSIAHMNRIRARHPSTPVGVLINDIGHARAQNKSDDRTMAQTRELEWIDHYLGDSGPAPPTGVEMAIETCEGSSGEPIQAADWASVARGELQYEQAGPKRIQPTLSETAPSAAFDPVTGDGACAEVPARVAKGTASYTMPAAKEGFTLAGAPLVAASFEARSGSQIAARLLDVDPDGNERLVARALWMPRPGVGDQVFELNPTAWRFEAGHSARLELLPADPGYGQVLPGQAQITVSKLRLRLPALEPPGSDDGNVRAVTPKPLPRGYKLALGFK